MRGDKHMAKKWISLVLAAIMVLLLVPAALAEESSAESTASAELNGTTLTASGGPYSFDGKAHAVSCRLENGKEYKNIYYSVDNGKTWTKTAQRLTDPGQLTVTVRAVKENGRDPLTVQVKLEVTKTAADGLVVRVNSSSVNIRKKADANSKRLGRAKKGETFKLLESRGKWYKIQYSSSQEGYVYAQYVDVVKEEDAGSTPKPTGKITGDTGVVVNSKGRVNIRSKASSSSKILGTATNGDTFKVLGSQGNWVKIEYKGKTAYIYGHYIEMSDSDSQKPTPTPKPTRTPKPTTVTGEKAYIVNCKRYVNVREEASVSSKKLGTLKKDAEVTVISIGEKWTKIAYKDGIAYVFNEYVSPVRPDDDVAGIVATIVNVKYGVNIRAKATSSSKILGVAYNGDTFTVQGTSGRWVKVEYNGGSAYIYDRYVKIG